MKRYKIVFYFVIIVLFLFQTLPYIITATYTFPLQDDFYNTGTILSEISEYGGGAFLTSIRLAFNRYFDYRGYFFSVFLTYLTDALTGCSIVRIRIWQTIMIVFHYISLVIMLYVISRKIMKMEKHIAIAVTVAVFSLFPSLFYFVNNETMFWLCASTIYQLPVTIIYIYVIVFMWGIDKKSKWLCLCCALIGFLLGGASVNVAVLACIATCQLIYWGTVVVKERLYSLVGGIPVLLGSALNVLAPSNYHGGVSQGNTVEKLIEAFKDSFVYEYDRIKMFIKDNPLFLTVFIVILVLFVVNDHHYTYRFPIPVVYTLLLIMGELAVIFPLLYVAGIDAYRVYERCIIVSDWTSYLMLMLIVFYWVGWFRCKLRFDGIKSSKLRVAVAGLSVFVIAGVLVIGGDKMASVRLAKELHRGEVQAYCNWVSDIIREVEQTDDPIVRIYTKEVEDTTCMANAFFNMGEYDPSIYTGNSAMSIFYGKEAVYLIDEGE